MSKLSVYLAGVADTPFSWTTWNCCHFAAGWVDAAEGSDILRSAGFPASAFGVLRAVKDYDGLPNVVTAHLHREPLPATLANVGDVVFFPRDGSAGIIAICNGVSALAPLITGGVGALSMAGATLCWKINQ